MSVSRVPDTLLIRADGDAQIGTGHVMRCLSLAAGWQASGGDAVLAIARSSPSLRARAALANVRTIDLDVIPGSVDDAIQTVEQAGLNQAAWIVADGYQFNGTYQQAVKSGGHRLLLVDDYGHARHYCADFVLNQNLSAREELYTHREPGTSLLLGTRYVLLSPKFLKYRQWRRHNPARARKVLVTLGGSDPGNATAKVIDALQGAEVEARFVVGGSNPHLNELSSAVRPPSSVVCDTPDMPELMAWADIAIAAAGSTSWELAFMGLPSLVLVLAENQFEVASAVDREGLGVNLGAPTEVGVVKKITAALSSSLTDQGTREAMSRRGRMLVDGEGVSRVVRHLRGPSISLRPATHDDSRRLWEWANDPTTRSNSFTGDPILWTTHEKWFVDKLRSPVTAIFIGLATDGAPFGQIRFDWNAHGDADIAVVVAPGARGGRLGAALIQAGVEKMLLNPDVRLMNAYVKRDNLASVRAFERAGFRLLGGTSVLGQEAWHLVLESRRE